MTKRDSRLVTRSKRALYGGWAREALTICAGTPTNMGIWWPTRRMSRVSSQIGACRTAMGACQM